LTNILADAIGIFREAAFAQSDRFLWHSLEILTFLSVLLSRTLPMDVIPM